MQLPAFESETSVLPSPCKQQTPKLRQGEAIAHQELDGTFKGAADPLAQRPAGDVCYWPLADVQPRSHASTYSLLLKESAIDGNSSFGAFTSSDDDEQDVARYISGDVDPRHAGLLGQGVGDNAALFVAATSKPL